MPEEAASQTLLNPACWTDVDMHVHGTICLAIMVAYTLQDKVPSCKAAGCCCFCRSVKRKDVVQIGWPDDAECCCHLDDSECCYHLDDAECCCLCTGLTCTPPPRLDSIWRPEPKCLPESMPLWPEPMPLCPDPNASPEPCLEFILGAKPGPSPDMVLDPKRSFLWNPRLDP